MSSITSNIAVLLYVATVVAVSVGITTWGREKSIDEFFFGGRKTNGLQLALSLAITSIWLTTGFAFTDSNSILIPITIHAVSLFILALIITPAMGLSGLKNPAHFYSRHSHPDIPFAISFLMLVVNLVVRVPLVLIAAGLMLHRTFGWDILTSSVFLLIVTGLLTLAGGQTAVLRSHTISAIVMIGSVLIATITNGTNGILSLVNAGSLPHGFRSEYSAGMIFGLLILGFWFWCLDPFVVRRVAAATDERRASHAGWLTLLILVIVCGCIWMVLQTSSAPVSPQNSLWTLLFWLSAMMAGLSSGLQSSAAIVALDFFANRAPKRTDGSVVLLGRLTITTSVILMILLTAVVGVYGSSFIPSLVAISMIVIPVATAMILGTLWRKSDGRAPMVSALIAGMIAGCVFVLTSVSDKGFGPEEGLSAMALDPFTAVGITFIVTLVTYVIVSGITGAQSLKNHKGHLLATTLIALILIGTLNGCTIDKRSTDARVAIVGDKVIDTVQLRQSFHLHPQWRKGQTQSEAYRQQLDFLVNEKLFALEARNNGLDKEPRELGYLDFIREKELVKALYREEVTVNINVNDEDLQRAYDWMKKTVSFEYILTPDSLRGARYAEMMRRGSINDIHLERREEETKGTKNEARYGDVAEELETAIFAAPLNTVSQPIRLRGMGFMIVKVIDGTASKFQSEYEFAEQKHKIHQILHDRKATEVSSAYIRNVLSKLSLRLEPEAFYQLAIFFQQRVKEQERDPNTLELVSVTDAELRSLLIDTRMLAAQTLISYSSGAMTVGEFISRLQHMPAAMRPRARSLQALKDAIAIVVRNKHLTQIAIDQGLDRDPAVRQQIETQQDEALAAAWFAREKSRLSISEEERGEAIRKIATTTNASADSLQGSLIENVARNQKFARLLPGILQDLRRRYAVHIDSVKFQSIIPRPSAIITQDPLPLYVKELFL